MPLVPYRSSESGTAALPLGCAVLLAPSVAAGVGMGAFVGYMPPAASPRMVLTWLVGLLVLSGFLAFCLVGVLRAVHVRSVRAARFAAVGSALVAAYVATSATLWFVWQNDGEPMPAVLAIRPDVVLGSLLTYGNDPGFPAFLLWLMFLPFVSVPWLIGGLGTGAPYCEACRRWAGPFGAVAHFATGDDPGRVGALVLAWDLERLLAHPLATDRDDEMDVVDAARCPRCDDFAVVRVRWIRYEGGKSTTGIRLSPHLAPGADLALLRDLVRVAPGAPAQPVGP